ncbi:MAG: hypothetical protein D6681_08145, partial [Calditrichaeota bacterium]
MPAFGNARRAGVLAGTQTPLRRGILLLLFLLSILNCKKEKPSQEISYPEDVARLVSQVTSGVISPDGAIRVRFASPVVDEDQVGKPAPVAAFEFSPPLEGTARWVDRQTVEFQPAKPLPMRRTFQGTVHLATLIPPVEGQEPPAPLPLRFEVAGREVAHMEAHFELARENDPRWVILQGEVAFTVPTEPAEVESAASLKKGRRSLKLRWEELESRRRFRFTSEPIERSDQESEVAFHLDGDDLQLSRDYQKTFLLPTLTRMNVAAISKTAEEKSAGLVVEFTDDLDPRQDISGLISLNPAVENLKIRVIGRKAYLGGDFRHGTDYVVMVGKGVRSRWGTVMEEPYEKVITFEDIKPDIKFASGGVFLPTVNQRKVRFLSVNVRRVQVNIQRVYESNLGYFLQFAQLSSSPERREGFYEEDMHRVGVTVYADTLELGEERNVWKQHELDLSPLIDNDEKGLYVIHIRFEREDMLWGQPEERSQTRYYYGEDYYSNPLSYGYLYAHGRIYKPVIVTDIGLTCKQGHQSYRVYATDLKSTEPLGGVQITLRSYQNQVIATRSTDAQGLAAFEGITEKVFYIEGEKDGQRSVIKLNEMTWNLSTFDVGGVEDVPTGVRAFIYTDRGVYRPGDEVHLSVIVRNDDNTFPDHHPVSLTLFNPLHQKVYEATNREGVDGFYSFTFRTGPDDPTGNWRAEIRAGSRRFTHPLKIETVVPFRLKVTLEPAQERLSYQDRFLSLGLIGAYLFGNPAAGLKAEVKLTLRPYEPKFPAFKGFVFSNRTVQFKAVEETIFSGNLDAQGRALISYRLPSLKGAPSALMADLRARIFEKGGRPNLGNRSLIIDPYPYYVGIRLPDFDYGYARVGSEIILPVILVNPEGQPVAGRPLRYRIYHGQGWWWWEADSREEYIRRFKSHVSTELISEGTLISENEPVLLNFTPEDDGMYLVEVQDGEEGHIAGVVFSAYGWGETPPGPQADLMTLKTDKPRYQVGETAVVTFPTPRSGRILLSLERGKRVLETRWITPDPSREETRLRIPITGEMLPTTYVSISIIQPYEQTRNDRPLRMYGVVPLNVEDPRTHQEITLEIPDELRPGQPFTVAVQTADHRPTQFTIAVVDEGLLALTAFPTPDPWNHFFQKLRLGVKTADLFGQVIAANKGDVFRTFSIGGGLEAARKAQLPPTEKKRFPPVAMFRGPLSTDEQGRARVTFTMPNYVGAVRVMVVSAAGNRYGRAEKTVPVKQELMVLPTLPRMVGPEDEFLIPVTVFAMKTGLGTVTVQLETEGPITPRGETRQQISFTRTGDKEVYFRVAAMPAVGSARIHISARAGGFVADQETHLQVRASSPRIYDSEEKVVERGRRITLTIPNRGIPGTNRASLSIRRRPHLNLAHRLDWLIRYPYGCIEQTVSSVFAQLYLKDFLQESEVVSAGQRRRSRSVEERIDRNINAAIRRLRRFQLASGAFAYWPGSRTPSAWGTNYAGHFLIEAKRQGYHVPEDMYRRWLKYQRVQALHPRENMLVQVYRVYLLAEAGEPVHRAMNLIKESHLHDLQDTEKWLLAAAYLRAGQQNTAARIRQTAGFQVPEYREFGGTYGSTLRDKAIILDMLTTLELWAEADRL